jgi:hypothetical protein
MMTATTNVKAAAVHAAWEALRPVSHQNRIRDAIRAYIAGLPQEAIDAAVVEMFSEMEILDEVVDESHGFRRWKPDDDKPVVDF